MAHDDIVRRKLAALEGVPDELINAVRGIQPKLFEDLVSLLTQLKTSGDSYTVLQQDKIDEILFRFLNGIFEGGYSEALTRYTANIIEAGVITNQYFSSVVDFTEKAEYRELMRQSVNQVLRLFNRDAVDNAFIEPLRQQLSNSVNVGSGVSETIETLRNFIEGDQERLGGLDRYVSRVARDAYAAVDRKYTDFIARDLGMEWYNYTSGTVSDSREFCVERQGGYYHRDEIASWAGLNWQGKAAGTDAATIFVFVGGYNCMHSLLPVPEDFVPLEWKERSPIKG